MSFGYDGEASGGVDPTTASGPLGRGERSLGKPLMIQERQVHCGRYPSCASHRQNARKGTGKRKGSRVLISIAICNAFNTARWNICIEAIVRKKVPDYLLRMIDEYLSDKWVIYQADKWYIYDDFLRMDLPAGVSIIGFADFALAVCAADDSGILELRINESLWRAKRWLDSRGLKMAPEKTKALLVTDRRSFQYSRIVLGEHEVEWKTSINYLGVQLDRRLSFSEHLRIAAAKAFQCGANLARLMPNIGGPREAKRRLVARVVYSKLLCAAPVWANTLQNHAIQKRLFSAQRSAALRIVLAYRTVSTSAVLVLASVPPIDLLEEERQETFQLCKELTCTDLQDIARTKEAICKNGRRRLVEKWHGEQTRR